jgi:hypothetical protein
MQQRYLGNRAIRGVSQNRLDQPGFDQPKLTNAGDFIFRVSGLSLHDPLRNYRDTIIR